MSAITLTRQLILKQNFLIVKHKTERNIRGTFLEYNLKLIRTKDIEYSRSGRNNKLMDVILFWLTCHFQINESSRITWISLVWGWWPVLDSWERGLCSFVVCIRCGNRFQKRGMKVVFTRCEDLWDNLDTKYKKWCNIIWCFTWQCSIYHILSAMHAQSW